MNSQGTSFIPQRPTGGKIKSRGVRKIYLLAMIAYILFFATVLAAGGVFFFKLAVEKDLAAQQKNLATEKSKFNQSDIVNVIEMNKRLTMAKDRMDKHISVLSILEALEHSAIQTVNFDSFDYKRPNDAAPVVTFSGTSDTFDSLLFQREVLQSNPILASAAFSGITLGIVDKKDSTGKTVPGSSQRVISFDLQSDIPVSLVGYTPRSTTTASQSDVQSGDILSEAPETNSQSTSSTSTNDQ